MSGFRLSSGGELGIFLEMQQGSQTSLRVLRGTRDSIESMQGYLALSHVERELGVL